MNSNNILESKIDNKINAENKKEYVWHLEIPSIDLNAKIKDGTKKEIMDDFIGHFEETNLFYGNVGLAAHNRGYKNNYFENLKKLKEGDLVIYYYKDNYREYVVKTKEIIKDTNWSYLEETEDNRLTLITCVENEPEYRRCIQCIEKTNKERKEK